MPNFVLLLVPLVGTAVGAWVAHKHGVSYVSFLPNVAAVTIGIPLLWKRECISSFVINRINIIAWSTLALIAATLLFPGTDSVRRWISLGPLSLNVSMALVPVFLFTLSQDKGNQSTVRAILLALVFLAQPDASQATAFAAASVVLLKYRSLVVIILAALTWLRVDPLDPIAHVERILYLADKQGPGASFACALVIIFLIAPFFWSVRKSKEDLRALSASFIVWLIATFAATEFGNFPVPVIGAGAAPVLGWILCSVFTPYGQIKRR